MPSLPFRSGTLPPPPERLDQTGLLRPLEGFLLQLVEGGGVEEVVDEEVGSEGYGGYAEAGEHGFDPAEIGDGVSG